MDSDICNNFKESPKNEVEWEKVILKRLHTLWLHLYNILWNCKGIEMENRLVVAKSEMGMWGVGVAIKEQHEGA